ncbi:MAG: DUF1571 domain-containing protein [Gemmataceae bacterium]|nr:DUF1571 domain-containing protein [Gemmataceae bacterium]
MRLASLLTFALGLCGAALAFAQPPSAGSSTQEAVEVAGRLIADAQASFAGVRDYSGLMYKQERVAGTLLPEQTVQIRVRQQPFSVGMKWLGPAKMAGQEAIYVAGKNSNQMRAKGAGTLLGAIGFMSFDPRDPKVMANNRHPITDAGLGNLIEQMARGHTAERQYPLNETVLSFGEYRFLNRPVTRMESLHPVNTGRYYTHRTVTYFDRETKLPVRIEAYDWPRQGGPAGGELIECYSYVDLKFNVGLTDAAFAN